MYNVIFEFLGQFACLSRNDKIQFACKIKPLELIYSQWYDSDT